MLFRLCIVKMTNVVTVRNFRLYLIDLKWLESVLSPVTHRNNQLQEAETLRS
jgi:hypothetical protein